MLDDVIESLIEFVEDAKPTDAKRAPMHPSAVAPLAIEQLEDRIQLAGDVAAGPVITPAEPVPAESGSFAKAPEIPADLAAEGGFCRAQADLHGPPPETEAEFEQQFAAHVHERDDHNGPDDGRVANRAGREPVEVADEDRSEAVHGEPIELPESQGDEDAGRERTEEELELITAEEYGRVETPSPAGEGSASLAEISSAENLVPQSAENPGAFSEVPLAASVEAPLRGFLSSQSIVDRIHESETKSLSTDAHGLANEHQEVAESDASPRSSRRGRAGADAAEAGDLESSAPLQHSPDDERTTPDQVRAHDACYSALSPIGTPEENVAAAIILDAPAAKAK